MYFVDDMDTLAWHTETLPPGLSFDMILVEGGEFIMGGADEEAYDDEKPVHKVSVSEFYIGQYPVTQAIWEAVMGNNPSEFKGSDRPVENVSWDDCQEFLKKLNKETGQTYRLPTEAEWEFAARGGIHSEEYLYAGSDKLKEAGWYEENSNNQTHPVGLKLGNELDLYDMSGNVWEWVEDQWHGSYEGAPTDGSDWVDIEKGSKRVNRGGSWFGVARDCRVSLRSDASPEDRSSFIGLRLALSLQESG